MLAWLLVGSLPSQASAAQSGLVLRGLIGTSHAEIHNGGPRHLGDTGSGPLIGGGIGVALGERWSIGVLGESVARRGVESNIVFTVNSLSLWAERHVFLEYPWSVRLSLNLGATRVHRNQWQAFDPPWSNEFSQHGVLIQPGCTLGWSPLKFLQLSGTVAYRWTSNGALQDSGGSNLIIEGKTVEVDLNGPVVLAGITVFLPWSGF